MLAGLKLIHHRHTGRLRPHEHTSYFALGILLLLVGLALTTYTAFAATPYTGPESGSVGLEGVMPGVAPVVAATIKTPTNGQHFSTVPIDISGTCPENTLVEVFKNDIFAGSTPCSATGLFTLQADLLYGQNTLIARVYDALNQAGPDSNAVVVYYDASPALAGPISSLSGLESQLIINTDAVYRGTFPGQQMNISIGILGGMPPYAINIMWGDSTNTVIARGDNVSFTTNHAYGRAGTYQASIQATDSKGRVAFLSFATIVNGQGNPDATGKISSTTTNNLLYLWPLFAAAVAIVASFFIGEKREKRVLRLRGLIQNPQVKV